MALWPVTEKDLDGLKGLCLLCKLSWQSLKAVLYSVSLENQNFESIRDIHAMKCDNWIYVCPWLSLSQTALLYLKLSGCC